MVFKNRQITKLTRIIFGVLRIQIENFKFFSSDSKQASNRLLFERQ